MCSLIIAGTFKGATSSSGIFLEEQDDVLSLEEFLLSPFLLCALQIDGELEEVFELNRGEVEFLEEGLSVQIDLKGVRVMNTVSGQIVVPVKPLRPSTALSREVITAFLPPALTKRMQARTLGPMLPFRKWPSL